MFERFTQDARRVVVEAQAEARSLGHRRIGTEHLLLAALGEGSWLREVLEPVGLTHDRVRREVRSRRDTDVAGAALRGLGIDVDEVRRRVEASFGPGALETASGDRRGLLRRRRRVGRHVPFTAEAKRSLQSALREALDLRSRDIRAEHVLLGVLRDEGQVTAMLRRLDVAPDAARRAVLARLGRAA